MPSTVWSRRQILKASPAVCLGVSGCLFDSTPATPTPESPSGTPSRSPTATPLPTATSRVDETPASTATNHSADTQTAPTYLGDFVLWNDSTTRHNISLIVHNEGTTVLEVQRQIEPNNALRIDNPIEHQGTYQIIARLEDGSEARTEWTIDSCSNIQYQQVYIGEEAGLLIRTKRQTIDPPPTCEDTPPSAGTDDRSAP